MSKDIKNIRDLINKLEILDKAYGNIKVKDGTSLKIVDKVLSIEVLTI